MSLHSKRRNRYKHHRDGVIIQLRNAESMPDRLFACSPPGTVTGFPEFALRSVAGRSPQRPDPAPHSFPATQRIEFAMIGCSASVLSGWGLTEITRPAPKLPETIAGVLIIVPFCDSHSPFSERNQASTR